VSPFPGDRMPGASDAPAYPWVTSLDVRFRPLERIDMPELVAACTDRRLNQTLCRVNNGGDRRHRPDRRLAR